MEDTLFFSTKSIGTSTRQNRKPQTLLDAVRHNRRQIHAEVGQFGRIDPERLHLNEIIAGPISPDAVVALAQYRMTAIGYAPDRRDYTQAFELMFSLPAGTTINTTQFFNSCMAWATEKFGEDVILSADVHRDEAAPHMHVLVSPIAGGRYLGTKLITKMEFDALRKSFAEMALAYGLREPKRKLYGAQRDAVAKFVIGQLEVNHDPILQSALWPMVKRDITFMPGRYASILGIDVPEVPVKAKRVKTLAELAVSPGKGPRHERTSKAIGFKESRASGQFKPIGFQSTKPDNALKAIGLRGDCEMTLGEKTNHSSVLVSPNSPTVSTHPDWHDSHPTAPTADTPSTCDDLTHLPTTRVKDADPATGAWDADRGEFGNAPLEIGTLPTQHAILTKAPTVAMVPGDDDRHVDRDDFYQPDFQDYEVQAWQE